jgi:hypothetical protein
LNRVDDEKTAKAAQLEQNRLLAGMSERQRRTYLRKLERGENPNREAEEDEEDEKSSLSSEFDDDNQDDEDEDEDDQDESQDEA